MANKPAMKPHEMTEAVLEVVRLLEHLCADPDMPKKRAAVAAIDELRAHVHFRQLFDLPKGWTFHGNPTP